MAFGIIRVRKLHAGDIAGTERHNARLYNSESEYPENIKIGGTFDAELLDQRAVTLQEAINNRLKDNKVSGIRTNSIHALEYVCAISEKKAWDNYSFEGFVLNTAKFLEEMHGSGSIIARYSHQDESNPHVHFVVVPLKTKKIKWKNQKGEGERTETRLNANEFVDGRDKLRALQDNWHKHLITRYGSGKHSKLGVDLFRGTLAEHQHKEYTQATNHKIALLSDEIDKTEQLAIKYQKMAKMEYLKGEMAQKEIQENQRKKLHDEQARNNWQFRGTKLRFL